MLFQNGKNNNIQEATENSPPMAWNFGAGRFVSEEENSAIIIRYIWILIFATAFLTFFGLTMIYSASYGSEAMKYFKSQILWICMGIGGAVLAYFAGYKKLIQWSPLMVIGVLILLGIAFCSRSVNGANRWIFIKLPGFSMSIQPSEFAKLVMALFVAGYCSQNFRTLPLFLNRNGLWKIFLISGIVLGAIVAGRDLGTTLLVAAMIGLILFAGGMPFRYIAIPIIFAVLLALYIYFFDSMRLSRVLTFLDPQKYQKSGGYQLWTSLMALGSGGWTGMGFLGSRFKAKYLPEQHTDFILSVVGEELGFLALLFMVIGAYVVFVFSALKISLNSKNKTGMLLGFGITSFIALQALINISVIAGLVPTKGMPAPFISYGGSNMLVCMTSVGVLISIGASAVNENYNIGFTQMVEKFKSKIFRRKNE
ncbi:MAG: FtsW/RodA/SpoVE family cell cycle protein [Lentisphaeria bacterium]|nr:FtsW/RodA/SpoVE family cell cycle protein [Lentisphaeria bacterium]